MNAAGISSAEPSPATLTQTPYSLSADSIRRPGSGGWNARRDLSESSRDMGMPARVTTVAEYLVDALAAQGTRTVWGVVGDALNPVTDAIRGEDRLEWIGVR